MRFDQFKNRSVNGGFARDGGVQLPIVGGTGFELVINSSRLEVIAIIKKAFGQRRRRPGDDAGNFHRLPGEKTVGKRARCGDHDLADGRLPIFAPAQFHHPDPGEGMFGFLVAAFNDFDVWCLLQNAAHGHDGVVVAQQGAQVVR